MLPLITHSRLCSLSMLDERHTMELTLYLHEDAVPTLDNNE